MTNEIIQNLDSAPGSPFDLKEFMGKAGIEGIEKVGNFAFIPTFSALGVATSDPYQDFSQAETPFFSAVFFDNENSTHVDFFQPGTLDFIKEEMNFVEGQYTPCEYINDLVSPSGLQGSPISIDIPYNEATGAFFGTAAYSDQICLTDNSFLVDGEVIPTSFLEVEMEVLGDETCRGTIIYNPETRRIEWTAEQGAVGGCTNFNVEFCYSSPMCPEYSFCETTTVQINIPPTFSQEAQAEVRNGTNKEESQSIKVFPNPTSDIINIESAIEIKNVKIIDSVGRKISESKETVISTSNINSSIIYIEVSLKNGEVLTKKVSLIK